MRPRGDLFSDLLTVERINAHLDDRLPVTYDHFLQGGYFNMPSARAGEAGEIGAGFSWVPPYRNYNLRVQLLNRLEISGNYRVFIGVDDPILTPMGFGDLSDKGANVKLILNRGEDSYYALPSLAIGLQDFIGTQSFKSYYIVATQVFLDQNFELSLGYGQQRIRKWFGGALWMPFRKSENEYLKGIAITAEYDATPYKDANIEKHPHGRVKKSPINFGVKYRLWDQYDFSISYVRGDAIALSASTFYNFGTTKGLIPKIDNPLPYRAPVNVEPLGCLRPENMLVHDLAFSFSQQGFDIIQMWLTDECGDKTLRLRIINNLYRLPSDVREQLNNLLAFVIPSNIDTVIIELERDTIPVDQMLFRMFYVRLFACNQLCAKELEILSPISEVTPISCFAKKIFHQPREWFNFEILPKTHTLFGSSRGKFKYALGVTTAFNGYLWNDIIYNVELGYIFLSNLKHLGGVDRLNPSQLINVRSDAVRFFQRPGVTVDQAYLQKNWNLGYGCYSRLALGMFEEVYGGAAAELLYYPVNCPWAVGIEAAILKKRTFKGVGFTNKIRKLDGFQVHHKHFLGSQYFLNFYYDWSQAQLDLEVKVGKFLANDWGVRYVVSRRFESGLKISIWNSYTNGKDTINGKTYHDKGIRFSMPLDIFYTHSDRTNWHYGMSAWIRDVGVTALTGQELYYMIHDERVDN